MINLILNIFNNKKKQQKTFKTFKTYIESWKYLFFEHSCDSMSAWIICFDGKFDELYFSFLKIEIGKR